MGIRHLLTKGIKAKKFYQREGGIIKDNSFGLDSNSDNLTIVNPPQTDDYYPFSETNEDFFSDFDTVDDVNDY